MKKAAKRNVRNIVSFMLIIVMMLSMTTSVFASWSQYNSSGTVYLEETWIGAKQSINFYSGGQWKRNVAGESHTLWINSIPVIYDLYDTCYWCFDKNGNTWCINTEQKLLLCYANQTTFVVNDVLSGCIGFQRDAGKIGYVVYTHNGGAYSLEDLLRNNYTNINNNGYNSSNNYYSDSKYPYVEKFSTYYYYYIDETRWHKYYFANETLKYSGSNYKSYDFNIESGVRDITFTDDGYIVYVNKNNQMYAYPIGSTSRSYRKKAGNSFFRFENSCDISSGYYNRNGAYQDFSYTSDNYYYDDYYYDDDDYYYDDRYYDDYYYTYPYIKKSGSNYFYYTSQNRYYKYYLSGSSLYYKGTNSSNSSTRIATNVQDITFWYDGYKGYVVYAESDDDIYAYEIGKTSTSYRKMLGENFSYFDENDYMSEGYYNNRGRYEEFYDYYDDDDYYYPYVKESGDYYYYYTSSNRYYKYYLSGSSLYYKGTNNSSSNTRLATSVSEITFSDDGYIVYATTSDYVYAYPLGKTSSSYKETVGKNFEYFDEDDYMSDGYYDRYDDFNWFDF